VKRHRALFPHTVFRLTRKKYDLGGLAHGPICAQHRKSWWN